MYRPLYGDEVANSIELGDEMEFPKPTEVLGRIAAQTAKQVIFQKVREAERENIFAEYNQRIGEVVNGTVKRFENGDIILEIGRIEAVLPRKEQSRAESYTPGDRVRTVIKGVNRSAKGPQIVLSRTDPALLIKLFEQEVPEIYDGTVMIRGAVREAGDRAKVAVFSRERDVDPVGACVGMKGTRVQSIIRELRGEKIDIVEWSEDPIAFVTNALSPAKVQRVSIVDDRERVMEVVVEDKQLSLAIGKKGQNVRLAAKLTGWRIDIKSEEEKRREVEAQFEGLEAAAETDARSGDADEADAERDRRGRRGRRDERDRSAAALHARRHRREDRPQARRRRVRRRRSRRGRDRRAAVGDSRHRREDRREDSRGRARRSAGGETRQPRARAIAPDARRDRYAGVSSLATVRIYKVAELLGTTSQEVTALLKRDHGIEVKSASSTIEEVVARQFVDRLARQRNITLPTGDIFAETPVVKGQEAGAGKKAPEPAKPAAPALPPPRLVKTAKPVARRRRSRPSRVAEEPSREPPPRRRSTGAESPRQPRAEVAEHRRRAADGAVEPRRSNRSAAEPTPPAAAAPPRRTAPRRSRPTPGRIVPPTLRLRIEEQRPTTPTPPLPTSPAPRVVPRPRAAESNARRCRRPRGPRRRRRRADRRRPAARPAAPPGAAPGGRRRGRAYPGRAPRPTPGGPRPLPSQPVRTQQPGMPPRPGAVSAAARACRRGRRIAAGGRAGPSGGAAPRSPRPVAAADAVGAAAGHAHASRSPRA